jgi:AraC-like DNA-binding protein
MLNMYEEIRASLHFNKFEIGEMLFVEYKCPFEDESAGIWTPMDSFIHVLSGKKSWRTTQGCWTAEKGQTLYIKKGAAIIDQYMDEDFCVLLLFVSDGFISDIVKENSGQLTNAVSHEENQGRAIRLNSDVRLSAYFQSMLSYFSVTEKPSEPLLVLKLKELILSILLDSNNPALASYFLSLSKRDAPSIKQTMEANFCYNLSIEDFAKLCRRSLSSFKRDFHAAYNVSPGKWLLQKRLEYSAVLLRNTDNQITQICFECGFEDLSHFSRAFKEQFGSSPAKFRKELDPMG